MHLEKIRIFCLHAPREAQSGPCVDLRKVELDDRW